MTITELTEILSGFHNVCYSGGAAGADRLFGLWASVNGQDEIHFSFKQHKYHVLESTVLELPQSILSDISVQEKLKKANKSLKRKVPQVGSYVYNLLARNAFQVIITDRVYCLAKIIAPDQIDGGTAWATQMYIDACDEPELYVYNILDNKPYMYDISTKTFIQVESVPKPHGKWTGIGSRSATIIDMNSFEHYFR
jgi:hypothetical protein